MTLLEILVKELPGKGGWPVGAYQITQDFDGEIWAWRRNTFDDGRSLGILFHVAENHRKECEDESYEISVTVKEYEAALAESKKVAWNGEGLPPAGCECEAKYGSLSADWFCFKCLFVDCDVAFGWAGKEPVTLRGSVYEFRPLRPEEERKRDDAIKHLARVMAEPDTHNASIIYKAIAAGEIPHVKIV